MRKLLLLLLGAGLSASAQQNPVITNQLNSTYFVKQVPGFYQTIQATVTKACSVPGATVDIAAGTSPTDTIDAVTGGCTTAKIVDERDTPATVYQWNGSQYVPVPSGGTVSPLTTKGDLYGFSTTNARIPVGTDGQVLTADSTQVLGLKWAAAAAGLPTATSPGQIIASTAAGATYAVQGQVFYAQSGDTISSIETECSSLCTYVVTTPQTITLGANHTLSSNVQLSFAAGGMWTVDGAFTLTIPGNVQGTLNQHFAGTSTIQFGSLQSLVPIEWFGGVGDGVMSTGAGTDNAPAFAKCLGSLTTGQCKLQAQVYLVHSAISITKSSVGIQGTNQGYSNSSIVGPATVIASTSSTAHVIDVTGPNSSAPLLWNRFDDFAIQRTVLPDPSSVGFSESFTCGSQLSWIVSEDHGTLFRFHSAASCNGGVFHSGGGWGYNVVPISSYTSGSFVAFDLDSEDGNAENSLYMAYVGAGGNGMMPGGTDYGFKIHGSAINDVNVFQDGLAFLNRGIYITYDGGGAAGTGGDIHFAQNTIDTSVENAIYISGIPASAGLDGINFDGGFLSSGNTGSFPAVDIESTSEPVVIDNSQIYNPRQTVTLNNSSFVTLQGNVLLGGNSGSQVGLNNSTHNSIVDNQLQGSFNLQTLVAMTSGSKFNQVSGNQLAGTAGKAFSFDATSNSNSIGSNSVDLTSITAYSSDLSTGQTTSMLGFLGVGGLPLAAGVAGESGYSAIASTYADNYWATRGAGTDEKYTRFLCRADVSPVNCAFETMSDALAEVGFPLSWSRTGAVVDAVTVGAPMHYVGYTVASLPPAGGLNAGGAVTVIDASYSASGVCVGGGSARVHAVSDGTNWYCSVPSVTSSFAEQSIFPISGTLSIAANSCTTFQTIAVPGASSSSSFSVAFDADSPTHLALTSGLVPVAAWDGASAEYQICNVTSSAYSQASGPAISVKVTRTN